MVEEPPVLIEPVPVQLIQLVSNFACIIANTKKKIAISELEDILDIMAEQNKKKRHLWDKDIEDTKKLLKEKFSRKLHSKLNHEIKLWQIEIEEKKPDKQHNLKMNRLELLEKRKFLPNKDDSRPKSSSNQLEQNDNF